MLKTLFFLIVLLLSKTSFGQIKYYSDCIKGGVVGDGYTAMIQGGISTVQLPTPAGSTIKKAFFFSNIYKWEGNIVPAVDKTIEINGIPLILSESDNIENTFYFSSANNFVKTIAIDITAYINPLISTYSINPLNTGIVPTPIPPIFSDFYILVLFENTTFSASCIDIYVNNFDTNPNFTYSLTSSNPINNLTDVGLAVHASSICDDPNDWFEVLINATSLGNIGGEEDNTTVYCAGTIGSFEYDNGVLNGIGNDNGDTPMNGLDAISNIQPIINGNENFNVTFNYVSNLSPFSNVINQLFLTYSTTCDTFSVTTIPDTTICPNTPLQLYATGGSSTGSAPVYEWLPITGLSCSMCPNPIFTGDSSQLYTVRIWNNDSCSVVRPVKVIVREEPQFGSITSTPTICGTNSGQVILSAQVGTATPISYSWNGGTNQPSGTFSNLFAGNQLFTLQDGFGCTNDTLITILENNPTIAQFSLDPTIGTVPLTVSVSNTSQFATDYSWWLNGVDQGNTFSSFVCDTSGTYSIELIAWQYDPSCADTFSLSVIALDRLIVPTAFTPDNDGVNDTWELPNIDAIYPKNTVQIFNRWGTLLYETKEGKYASNSWDGTFEGMALPVGSYYFIIDLNVEGVENLNGVVSVVLDTF